MTLELRALVETFESLGVVVYDIIVRAKGFELPGYCCEIPVKNVLKYRTTGRVRRGSIWDHCTKKKAVRIRPRQRVAGRTWIAIGFLTFFDPDTYIPST